MTRHVLVPFDGSEQSRAALEYAADEFAEEQLSVLYVVDPADFYSATGVEGGTMTNYEQIKRRQEARADDVLRSARELASERGVEIDTEHVVGAVAKTIVEYAEDEDVDHIVVGSHGRTGASRILLGSVAEAVARRSPVPVTIVR